MYETPFMLLPLTPPPTLPLQRYCVSIYVLVNGLGKWGTILLGNVGGGNGERERTTRTDPAGGGYRP